MKPLIFSAGPAKQSPIVTEQLVQMIKATPSVMEISHRSKEFQEILHRAKQALRTLLDVPDDMEILFLSGGASFQFLQCAANLHHHKAAYLITGLFSKLAYEAALAYGACDVLYDNSKHPYELNEFVKQVSGDYDYVYVCLNNSLYGTRTPDFQCDCPIVADASSLLGIEKIDFSKVDICFASAQKNFGISGLSIVIVRKTLKFRSDLNPLISYDHQIKADSLLNTPPVLSIAGCMLCAEELLKRKDTLYEENRQKAHLLYDFLDQSSCYEPLVSNHRSLMNVTFCMKTDAQEKKLLEYLLQKKIVGIQGHARTGHLRASLNVFVSKQEVITLIEAMQHFELIHHHSFYSQQ